MSELAERIQKRLENAAAQLKREIEAEGGSVADVDEYFTVTFADGKIEVRHQGRAKAVPSASILDKEAEVKAFKQRKDVPPDTQA